MNVVVRMPPGPGLITHQKLASQTHQVLDDAPPSNNAINKTGSCAGWSGVGYVYAVLRRI